MLEHVYRKHSRTHIVNVCTCVQVQVLERITHTHTYMFNLDLHLNLIKEMKVTWDVTIMDAAVLIRLFIPSCIFFNFFFLVLRSHTHTNIVLHLSKLGFMTCNGAWNGHQCSMDPPESVSRGAKDVSPEPRRTVMTVMHHTYCRRPSAGITAPTWP